jgi:acetyl-CoA carboxylase biotin carboxylase subunit
MVTGIDLVREQIRVAAGEPLSFGQDDVEMTGWAVECRINAEDPEAQFRPSPGVITKAAWPSGPWVRVDAGVTTGSEVQPFYDGLLAKVVTWGRDRTEAVERMRRALAECSIEGVQTTTAFHEWLLSDEDFRQGRIHTQFLSDRIAGI